MLDKTELRNLLYGEFMDPEKVTLNTMIKFRIMFPKLNNHIIVKRDDLIKNNYEKFERDYREN